MFPAQDVRVGGRLGPLAISVHAVELRSRRAAEMGAERGRAREARAGRRRCLDRPRAGRLPAQRLDRPAGGRAPRRARAGHRRGARECLCAAADLDHLYPAQPVPRRSWRSIRSTSATRTICRTSTSAARGGTQIPLSNVAQLRAQHRAAGGQSSGPVSGRHHLVRTARGRGAGSRHRGRAAGGARHAPAGHRAGGVRRRREGLRGSRPARSRC